MPQLPREAAHLWAFYLELDAARRSNGFGPDPIGFPEIAAWSALTDNALEPWEVYAIRRLDQAYLSDAASRTQRAKPHGK